MNTPRANLIVAPDEESARDEALTSTVVGDHVFFVLPDSQAASALAETFRDRDVLAASAGLDAGPLALVTSAVLAHGGVDRLVVVVRPQSGGVHECEPADLLDSFVAQPWDMLRAAAPFLRERKGQVRFVVQGTDAGAELVRAALAALAQGWSAATGLDAQLQR